MSTHAAEMPAPWRDWARRRVRRAPAPILASLNVRIGSIYTTLVPGAPELIAPELRRFLRQAYLCQPSDLRRVRSYAAANAHGIRLSIAAAAQHPDAKRLLGPEILLVLERLARDPLGLRNTWPADEPLDPLLALAATNGRPYWD